MEGLVCRELCVSIKIYILTPLLDQPHQACTNERSVYVFIGHEKKFSGKKSVLSIFDS